MISSQKLKSIVCKKNDLIKPYGLLFLLLLTGLSLLFTSRLLTKRIQLFNRAESPSSPPEKVRLTNINPSGFTVTWITPEKTTGSIVYGDKAQVEKSETNTPKAEDERGEGKISFTHSVKINNLEAGKKYYFKILSGNKSYYFSADGSWNQSGIAQSITLPSLNFSSSQPFSTSNSPGSFSKESLAFSACSAGIGQLVSTCFRPNPIYGHVYDEGGSLVPDSLVYLEIPGSSSLLSGLTDNEGQWILDLSNLLKEDLSGPFGYQPGVDLLRISAISEKGKAIVSYRAIPETTIIQPEKISPIKLTLLTALGALPTKTPTSSSATPTPVPPTATNTPKPASPPIGTLNILVKLQDKGEVALSRLSTVSLWQQNKLVSSEKVTLFPSSGKYSGKLSFYKTGNYTLYLKPDGYLKKNLGQVDLIKGENQKDYGSIILVAGDVNNDNKIDCLDISVVLGQISRGATKGISDLNQDKKINEADLSILISNYRKIGD